MLNPNHPERETITLGPEERKALCRCWQSKTFPYCDGSHQAYNDRTGDTLGPIIVTGQPQHDTLS